MIMKTAENSARRIHQWFVANNQTLAAAESLTSGRLQAALTLSSGASSFFLGGITAYTISIKALLLGVNEDEARKVNAVSASVARQMAFGVLKRMGADYAIATTGFAEPSPADGVPHPKAHYAVVKAEGFSVIAEEMVEYPGLTRNQVQDAVTADALHGLCKALQI